MGSIADVPKRIVFVPAATHTGEDMKLSVREIDLGSIVISPEQLAPRTAGLHVSSIIQYISETVGRRDNEMTREQLDRYAIFGRIWEKHLADALFIPPRYERIGEVERDGIIGSPDSIDLDSHSIQEFKCTWKSVKRPIETFNEWFWQIKAYCFMLDTPRATLYPVFINGDWKPPCPQFGKAIDCVFSLMELKENWAMLERNAEEMQ